MFREQVSGDVEVIFLFVCLCTVCYGFDCTYDGFHGGNTNEETLMLPLKYCLFTNTEKRFFPQMCVIFATCHVVCHLCFSGVCFAGHMEAVGAYHPLVGHRGINR